MAGSDSAAMKRAYLIMFIIDSSITIGEHRVFCRAVDIITNLKTNKWDVCCPSQVKQKFPITLILRSKIHAKPALLRSSDLKLIKLWVAAHGVLYV